MKPTLLFLLVLFPFISLAQNPGDTVDIPDPHFKYALLHAQDFNPNNPIIDNNENGEIEYSEAEAVTYLNLLDATLNGFASQNKQLTPPNENEPEQGTIHDLTGIEAFTNLTYLNIESNDLTSVNLSQNTVLDTLICDSNQLTSLDLSQNSNLKKVRCSHNQIVDLEVSQCSELEFLNCSVNNIATLDISENPNLKYLHCYGNSLTNLNVTQNIDLETLECMGNHLTNLDLSQNVQLNSLWCSNNQLTSLDVSQNPQLDFLRCQNNHIQSLDVSNNLLHNDFRCQNNEMTYLNFKNHNGNIYYFSAENNPNLTCIFVDDTSDFEDNPDFHIDPNTHFVETQEECESFGVNDYNFQQIKIYPNPVRTNLHIVGQKPIKNISLYNLQGEKLKIYNRLNRKSIDLSTFPSGIYFLKIETNHSISTRKIIKL